MNTLLMAPILGVIGMVVAFVVYQLVMKYPDGEDKVKKIGDQIHNGASVSYTHLTLPTKA